MDPHVRASMVRAAHRLIFATPVPIVAEAPKDDAQRWPDALHALGQNDALGWARSGSCTPWGSPMPASMRRTTKVAA